MTNDFNMLEEDPVVEPEVAAEQTDDGENGNVAAMAEVKTVNNLVDMVIEVKQNNNKQNRNLSAKIFVVFHNIVNGELVRLTVFESNEKNVSSGRPIKHSIPGVMPRNEKVDHNAELLKDIVGL